MDTDSEESLFEEDVEIDEDEEWDLIWDAGLDDDDFDGDLYDNADAGSIDESVDRSAGMLEVQLREKSAMCGDPSCWPYDVSFVFHTERNGSLGAMTCHDIAISFPGMHHNALAGFTRSIELWFQCVSNMKVLTLIMATRITGHWTLRTVPFRCFHRRKHTIRLAMLVAVALQHQMASLFQFLMRVETKLLIFEWSAWRCDPIHVKGVRPGSPAASIRRSSRLKHAGNTRAWARATRHSVNGSGPCATWAEDVWEACSRVWLLQL